MTESSLSKNAELQIGLFYMASLVIRASDVMTCVCSNSVKFVNCTYSKFAFMPFACAAATLA